MPAAPGRDEVVAMLAGFGDRAPEEVPEGIDSMELAWLAHQIEQRYDRRLDDDTLARLSTVSDVVELLGRLGDLRPGPA
ncbi:acyl carrier protein [Kitasatospora indigofera]|uniref:acyl carrier protein n=1 Tax=Kitasatospora indigofera TaxID=67307 RepID=UPI0033A04ECC